MNAATKRIRNAFKRFRQRIRFLLMRLCAGNRTLASLYYAFCNRGYSYEQRAFLHGKLCYKASLTSPHQSMALLRRNVHRLEKGLLMRPQRIPFALEYIGETVRALDAGVKAGGLDHNETKWAIDVLGAYFDACRGSHEIAPHQAAFLKTTKHWAHCPDRYVPYLRNLTEDPSVTYADLLKLAKRRRSVRWFLPEPVPRELLDKAIELGCYAPSACNRQPYKFRIFDDANYVQKIIQLPGGTKGYSHNVQCVIAVTGKLRNYFDEKDRHLIYIDSSLATMGLLFALESLGLSSCCINWPEVAENDDAIRQVIGLHYDERVVMLIAVGFPDPKGMVAYSAKKSINVVRSYNFEGQV